jgi:microsomal dipeptidase-like Zn-dependent dipeptidase
MEHGACFYKFQINFKPLRLQFTRDLKCEFCHGYMSLAGIEQTLPLLTRPFTFSHGALRNADSRPGHLRRYNAATRNVPESVASKVGARGGLFGVVMATQLLGGSTLNAAALMVGRALAAAGEANVAIGSDMTRSLRHGFPGDPPEARALTSVPAGAQIRGSASSAPSQEASA